MKKEKQNNKERFTYNSSEGLSVVKKKNKEDQKDSKKQEKN